MSVSRLSWDEYFMDVAIAAKKRSTCIRRQIGAIAVKDKRILCTGYNGSPPNTHHCLDVGCIRDEQSIKPGTMHEKCRAIHAEQNLIIQAAIHGIALKDSTIYCTNQPCIICMKMIVGIHPERLVYQDPYPDKDTIDLLHSVAAEEINVPGQNYTSWNFFNWE